MIETVSTKLDESKENFAIFLFHAKAFSFISHNFFLKKLKCMVFIRKQKNCCFLFLANRRQKVKLNGMFSDRENVNHCVPQGAILGLLIFHVNDFLSNTNTTEKVLQFAY